MLITSAKTLATSLALVEKMLFVQHEITLDNARAQPATLETRYLVVFQSNIALTIVGAPVAPNAWTIYVLVRAIGFKRCTLAVNAAVPMYVATSVVRA